VSLLLTHRAATLCFVGSDDVYLFALPLLTHPTHPPTHPCRFDFAYKQRVGSEDVFLGLSGTTPSSIHCDTLVMKVLLPGERLADIDLNVAGERVTVSSGRFKLSTYLPVKVLRNQSNAAWDAAKGTLSITFTIDKA